MRARVVSGAVLTALLLSSCSIGGDEIPVRAAVPGATTGGTITIAIGAPATIDPGLAFEPWGRLVDSLICDALIQLDPVTGEPVPAIAESWIISRGGAQLTVKIRKGIRFHDGSTMSVDDIAFALSRVASQETGSNVAGLLRPVLGWTQIHGDDEAKTEEAATALAGVRVVGTDAVQITLTDPRADFFRVLAHSLASPVPRKAVTRDPGAFESKPVCTGPYKLEHSWKRGDATITLVRFEGYYGGNRGYSRGGRGYADRIELRIVDPAVSRALGKADAAPLAPGAAPAGLDVVAGTTPYLEYIGLPATKAPFDRREVRVALSQAINRAAIARDVYGGTREVAQGFLGPALGPLYRRDACGARAPATGDTATARRSLADAGIDLRGSEITLSTNTDFRNRELVEAVARSWREAFGVAVRIATRPWDAYLDAAASQAGLGGAFRMGFQAPYLGPDAVLAPLFASSSIGRENFSRFSDPRFDRVLEREARRASSDEDLQTTYQRLEDLACEQLPVIPLLYGRSRWIVRGVRVGAASEHMVDVTTGALAVRELYLRGTTQ
jgi:oligopeptide transport system substrate-binding protein